MINNDSSSQDSVGFCSLHDVNRSTSTNAKHVCRCSKLKIMRAKAEEQVQRYKNEKSYIRSIRETLDEEMRKKSIRDYLDENSDNKEKSSSSSEQSASSSFMDCTESCISHKKPHHCSEKKKEIELMKSSNISTQTRESMQADDEDSEQKGSLVRPSTRKSSKKPSIVAEVECKFF